MAEDPRQATPGTDGEIEGHIHWGDEKAKRGSHGAPWRRIAQHPLFWAFVGQFICLAALFIALIVVTGALDLSRLRCIVPGQCMQAIAAVPSPLPFPSAVPTIAPTDIPAATEVSTVNIPASHIVSIDVRGTTTTITMTVDAAQGWQPSLTSVEQNANLTIAVIDGQWTEQKGVTPYNAGIGQDYICSAPGGNNGCVEPMPSARKGALLGEVGNRIFEVDNHTTLKSPVSGMISLRINDPDFGLYDNDGILTVRITISGTGAQ